MLRVCATGAVWFPSLKCFWNSFVDFDHKRHNDESEREHCWERDDNGCRVLAHISCCRLISCQGSFVVRVSIFFRAAASVPALKSLSSAADRSVGLTSCITGLSQEWHVKQQLKERCHLLFFFLPRASSVSFTVKCCSHIRHVTADDMFLQSTRTHCAACHMKMLSAC